jgi:hypothetical protein
MGNKVFIFLVAIINWQNANAQSKGVAEYNAAIYSELIRLNNKGIDTIIAFGDFCSGCLTGTEKSLYIFYNKNGYSNVDEYRIVNNRPHKYLHKGLGLRGDSLLLLYRQSICEIDNAILKGEGLFLDTITKNGRIFIQESLSDGPGQFIYLRYGKKTIWNFICCQPIDAYKEKSYPLWHLLTTIKKLKY